MHPDGTTRKRAPRRPAVTRACALCGAAFRANPSQIDAGGGRFCSRSCSGRGSAAYRTRPEQLSQSEWVWSRIKRTDDPLSCWEWQGARIPAGYGSINPKAHEGEKLAHRLVWHVTYGPIPEGQWVLHKCDNPPCCRPDHLFLGTHRDNMTDMASKGRQWTQRYPERVVRGDAHPMRRNPDLLKWGERNPRAKLTEGQVVEIHRRYAAGGISQPALAAEYGVDQALIWRIVHRKAWRHVLDHDAAPV